MNGFLERDDCLLLVIDIQERLHASMEAVQKDAYVKNGAMLIRTARTCGMPVVVTEQYPRGLGKTIEQISREAEGIEPFAKLHFSCCRDEAIRGAIDGSGRKTAILMGIETHVCVMQTAVDLQGAGYRVAVGSDAVCSRRADDRTGALRALAAQGVLVYPAETVAFMLIEKAGTDLFRELSPLFK